MKKDTIDITKGAFERDSFTTFVLNMITHDTRV